MPERRAMAKITMVVFTAVVILSACDSSGQGTTPAADFKYPAEASAAVQAAKSDLTKTNSISQQGIIVVNVQKNNWPSVALGCPKPGIAYTTAFMPGYLVLLSANGQNYEYHTDDQGRSVVLC